MPAYSQNEIQVVPGDNIEFAVPIANLNGLVDLSSFQWEDPQEITSPKD